ncbi:MAG: phosphoglycerate mutase [Rhodanobacter sp.]
MSLAQQPLILWLPALAHFDTGHPLLAGLARADRLSDGRRGFLDGLGDYFAGADNTLAAAAITREFLAGDARDDLWLSADPAWVQPDLNGVRLLACGQLQIDADEAESLAAPLREVFAEAGMQLELSTPDRWHLRIPAGTLLPTFAAPEQALGEDLSQHLPQGEQGRRWRLLLNDIQVLLHQHPGNAARSARGLAPVNSLWLWGGGTLPSPLRTELTNVISNDLLMRALSARAGVSIHGRADDVVQQATGGWLVDLQDLPAIEITSTWWPVLQPLLARQPVQLHFASGERWIQRPWHRWRVWRGAGR